jgi:superfamily II DNA or RNA helicase
MSKLHPDWKLYEFQICKYHNKTYSHAIWHVDNIPEEELENCGIIHSYNEHRLKRIRNKRLENGKSVLYNDYGIDALVKDTFKNTDQGLQVKCYTKNKVSANDLGSFFVIFNILDTDAYLYTTTDLEINFKYHLQAFKHNKIIVERVPLETDEPQIIGETSYELRPYQLDAIEALCSSDINKHFLNLFPSGGKTLICGHVLKRYNSKFVLCIAPLKVSVMQLKDRITPFLSDYEVLLVDSDGTTDESYVKTKIETNNKLVIFSTFDSTENILSKIVNEFDNAVLVIDEVHNIINNTCLCEFANNFNKAVYMSGTIPEELKDVLEANESFTYSLCDGIRNNYCCPYQVWLPYLSDGRVQIEIPQELKDYDNNMLAKTLFLTTGMFKTGSRRCIGYFGSQSECDLFLDIAKNVFETYHAAEFWGQKIDCSVSNKDRLRILNDFAKPGHEFKVIASIRILDEAIDIPCCDSQFVSHVGDNTSDIRTVQRLCRGTRLDPNNPNKMNNMFMWCEDWSKSINCLSLLRDSDPEFHTKVRCLNANYDKGSDVKEKQLIGSQEMSLKEYINVSCLILEERWYSRLEAVKRYIDEHGKRPTIKDNKTLGNWVHDQVKNYKQQAHSMKSSNIREEWKKFIEKYEDLFLTYKEKWFKSLDTLKAYIEEHGKRPTIQDDRTLGCWVTNQAKNYKTRSEAMKDNNIREEWEKFVEKYEDLFLTTEEKWFKTLDCLKIYIDKHGKRPTEKYDTFLGHWIRTQVQNYKNKSHAMKNKDIREEWEMFVEKYEDLCFLNNEEKWFKTLDCLKIYIDKHGKRPTIEDDNCLGKWVHTQAKNYRKHTQCMKKEDIREEWKTFTGKYEDLFMSNEDKWFKTLETLKTYIEEHGKRPTEKDNKFLGKWVSHQVANYKNNTHCMKNKDVQEEWERFMQQYSHVMKLKSI